MKAATNHPDSRTPFARLTVGQFFRLPHEAVVYEKRGPILADVAGAWKAHPHAPRAGFFHPAPDREVILVSAQDAAAAADPEEVLGIAGLILNPDGGLTLVFHDAGNRQIFLTRLALLLDDTARGTLRLGRTAAGHFCATVHHTHLTSPLKITIPETLHT